VSSDLSLCRFLNGGDPHLGLIVEGQLYDLTATGRPEYATFQAWLSVASGRPAQAIAQVSEVAAKAAPIAPAEALLDPSRSPRVLAPLDTQEVWACGVTYKMSMAARKRESQQPSVYGHVYEADRPEIFFKATPHRVVGPDEAVAIRGDSTWDVPESELALVVTPALEIVGYTVGNDMSSREIEGANPLYLPQAKLYDRCCALGPVVRLARDIDPTDLPVELVIHRDGAIVFRGESHTSRLHRSLPELVSYLGRCNSFPTGIIVCTGTGVIPPDSFTLEEGDVVEITLGQIGTLRNPVVRLPVD
jgi:2-dehydro-3-deoxy-D-arabinonate dehydratase